MKNRTHSLHGFRYSFFCSGRAFLLKRAVGAITQSMSKKAVGKKEKQAHFAKERGKPFSTERLFLSFKYAFQGLKAVFKEEQSFRVQLLIAFIVIVLMLYFPLTPTQRTLLVLTITAVLGLELLNSQLERILDLVDSNHSVKIKRIKDISAAAVLVAVIGSVLIALFIFLPYLVE